MKVLGTKAELPYEMFQKIKTLSDKELHHNQFRIICRCKGLVDANRKCQAENLGERIFLPRWTSISVNKIELELCETEDIWICKDGTLGDDFVSIKELQ